MKKILMIVGSLRKESFNRQLAEQIKKFLADRAEVSFLEYADLPYMDQDIEYPAPEAVARVRAEVQAAHGLWICSPEYNYSFPGVLKNLLDWLSRPLAENDWSSGSAVKGKPVTISGVAGKSAAAGVRSALKQLLTAMRMEVVGGDGTGVSLTPEAFATGKAAFSKENIAALTSQVEEFLKRLNG